MFDANDPSPPLVAAPPESVQALAEAALMLTNLGELDAAADVADALLLLAPARRVPHILKAMVLTQRGDAEAAAAAARQGALLPDADPTSLAWALNVWGEAEMKRGHSVEARRLWQRARDADTGGPGAKTADAHLRLAELVEAGVAQLPPTDNP